MIQSWTYSKALAAAIFITLVMLTNNVFNQYDDLISANLPNPDSYYKLVLIKDYDPAHGIQFVARDNAPEGSWIHWSMPHTWTIMQLHKGLMLLGVDSDKALLLAGGGLTILSMLLLATLVSITILNIGSNLAAVLAVLALATSFPLFGYGQLVQITHHIYMLVPIAAACVCFFRKGMRTHKIYDFIGGALLGLAIWISPETMPLMLAVAAARAALQLQQKRPSWLWPAALGLMMTLISAWAIDPPPPTFQPWALDHISLAWLLFGALIATLMLVVDICVYQKLSFKSALLVLIIALALSGCAWLWIVPGALHGPSGLIPLELKALWWSKIKELQPVSTPSQWVAYLFVPALSGFWLVYIAWKERQLWLLILAFSTLAYSLLGVMHIRMGAASALISALALGICLSRVKILSSSGDPAKFPFHQKLFGTFIIILLPAQAFIMVMLEGYNNKQPVDASCDWNELYERLAILPAGVVMLPLNKAPELLFKTHHYTVSGNYHHNVDGLLDVVRFFNSPKNEIAENIINKRAVKYIAYCNNKKMPHDVGFFNKIGFSAKKINGISLFAR